MGEIRQKIKQNKQLNVILSDLHLISLLAMACFFTFEKIWPGLISFYIHPAILLAFWIVFLYLDSLFEQSSKDWIKILAGIVLILLVLLFYRAVLGPWIWMILLLLPVILLLLAKKHK